MDLQSVTTLNETAKDLIDSVESFEFSCEKDKKDNEVYCTFEVKFNANKFLAEQQAQQTALQQQQAQQMQAQQQAAGAALLRQFSTGKRRL
jgi:hypothetical protein